ncbi:hypothetical protein [uncultured Microbulbifer sp.]|uniref:hypothetical protein n=1 Tax=uncultured Microbulbifer sp. TaxID=348147 RepID=UPI0025E58AC0|nr:hypothetical protein [uncultured Microbulbifer sp.]
MSFCKLTDGSGNTYLLSASHWIQSPAPGEYVEAVEALARFDCGQLFEAENSFFFHLDGELQQRLSRRLGPNWRDAHVSNSVLHPAPGNSMSALPGRWPLILDAIYHGDIRFTKIASGSTKKDAPPVEDNRAILRVKIRQALAAIVAQEKAEAAQHTRLLEQETRSGRALIYTGAFLTGLWNAGADFAQWLKDVNDVLNPVHRTLRGIQAGQKALQRNSENGDNLLDAYQHEVLTAEKRELVQVLGFDPSSITREQFHKATELADLIWEDPTLQADLRRFVKDYVKAQHTIEITEFSGAAAFEVLFTILLAAVTAGAGLAASAAAQARHFIRFRKVGDLLLEFGDQVKKIRRARHGDAAGKEKAGFADFESHGEVEAPRPAEAPAKEAKPKTRGKTDFSKRKGVPPASLEDAVKRLNSMTSEISRNGYQPKYTDTELKALAQSGDVSQERFQVRFMESRYLTNNGEPGMLGAPMRGVSGNGAKYWSTSFDQLEDADSDARLISEKLGLDYNPKTKYALIVIDTEKSAPLTGVKSVPATFEKVSKFANKELPDDFPEGFTDITMTPEFQEQYAQHYQAAVDGKFLKTPWSTQTNHFSDYLDTTDLSDITKEQLKQRMAMQSKIGNNQYYEGNGLTRNNIKESDNQFGAVETLNFERKPVNLQQLEDAEAITYVSKDL